MSEAAPWLALDRKNFVAAAKSLADGDVGPHLPTKSQLRQVAEVYFAMAKEDFQQEWDQKSIVLVKGSRSAAMERFVKAILNHESE